MSKQIVYIVLGEMFYEGDSVLAVFASYDAAQAYVKSHSEGATHEYDRYHIMDQEVK